MGFCNKSVCLSLTGLFAVCLLTACGGGGGNSSKAPSPTLPSSIAVSSVAPSSVVSSTALSSTVPSSTAASLMSSAASSQSSALPGNRRLEHVSWSFNTKSKVRSTAVTTDNNVIFGVEGGMLYALDLETGSERWRLDTGGAVSSHLLLADGKVIFLNHSGKIMAVDATAGTQVWVKTTTGEHFRPWGHHLASALLADDRIYIGSSSGKLYGLMLDTGEEVWSVDIQSAIHTKPALVDGTLYVSSDTAVHAINIATKSQRWSVSLNNPTSPAIEGNTLVVGGRDANVHGLDATTGAKLWRVPHGMDWVSGDAVILDGIAYIGSSDDETFQAIDRATGSLKWQISTGGNVFSRAAFEGDIAYISSGDSYATPGTGMVQAVNKSGRVQWSMNGKNFFASPVVKNGKVYIGSDDGYFYAMPAL